MSGLVELGRQTFGGHGVGLRLVTEAPLHGFPVFLQFFAERLAELPGGAHPACLVESYCYQKHLFSLDTHELNRAATPAWRRRFHERFQRIAERYPPCIDLDLQDLAAMASALVDGSITLSKIPRDATLMPKQVMLYRAFVRAAFAPG